MNTKIVIIQTEKNSQSSGTIEFLEHEFSNFGMSNAQIITEKANSPKLKETLKSIIADGDFVVFACMDYLSSFQVVNDTVCDFFKCKKSIDKVAFETVQEYSKNNNIQDVDYKQFASFPSLATVFPNDHGMIDGYALYVNKKHVMVLPGKQNQLIPMVSDYVSSYLTNAAGGTIFSRTVGVFGLSEAVLVQRLADMLSGANPNIEIFPKDGEAIIRVTAHADGREDAKRLCDEAINELGKRLGVNIYGVDLGSLQKAVIINLLDKSLTLSVANSNQSDVLSEKILQVSRVSNAYKQNKSAYNRLMQESIKNPPKELGDKYIENSAQAATIMAVSSRITAESDLGISITEAQPSQTNPEHCMVYIALADKKRVWVKKMEIPNKDINAEYISNLATIYALDLIRRYLDAYPTVMAGGEALPVLNESLEEMQIPYAEVVPQKRNFFKKVLPWKGDSAPTVVLKSGALFFFIAFIVVILVVLVSLVSVPKTNKDYYQSLKDLCHKHTDTSTIFDKGENYPKGMLNKFGTLYKKNSDIRGWIKIQDTKIDYPFMTNNPEYEKINFDKERSSFGTPYLLTNSMESKNNSVVAHTIIGNNYEGQMFADIVNYENLDFLQEHPVITLDTLYETDMKFEIFSVFLASDPLRGGEFDYNKMATYDRNYIGDIFEEEHEEFVLQLSRRSLYNYPEHLSQVNSSDTLLLLTTSYNGVVYSNFENGQIVVAAKQCDNTSNKPDLTKVQKNSYPVMPNDYPKAEQTEIEQAPAPEGTNPHLDETTIVQEQSKEDGEEVITTQQKPSPSGTTKTSSQPTQSTESTENPNTDGGLLVSDKKESYFLKNFKFKDSSNNNKECYANSKEQLVDQLFRIVKAECGSHVLTDKGKLFEAQKAQAVSTYTYILYENIVNGKVPECPTKEYNVGTFDKNLKKAVEQVAGIKLLMTDGKTPLYTPCFAASPGVTADNKYIFGNDLPHLKSVPSPYEEAIYNEMANNSNTPEYEHEFSISLSELTDPLEKYCKKDVSFDTDGKQPFYVRNYDPTNKFALYTNAYIVESGSRQYILARQMRYAIGTTKLRSFCFKVKKESTAQKIVLTVKGYGHGVGLSQYGAAGYAKRGKTYLEILNHYYSIKPGNSKHQLYAANW